MKPKLFFRHTSWFVIISIGIILEANAQTPPWDTLSYRDYSDFKLQPLNKSYITTGILYDRMFPIADVDDYKGSMSMTDTTTPDHFMQALCLYYHGMEKAG